MFLACRPVQDHTGSLFPDELTRIERAADSRRRTFSSGRFCARSVLADAGLPADISLPGNPDGSVAWPAGVAGSITHTDDWAVAGVCVQAMSQARAIGIDLEKIQPLEEGVMRLVATQEERQELESNAADQWQATALFGLKESIYKCLRPTLGEFFDFQAVCIRNLATGRPRVEFIDPKLQGRFVADHLELRMAVSAAHVFSLAWLHHD